MTDQPTTFVAAPPAGYTPPAIRIAATYPAGAGEAAPREEGNH